jgi:casein kinase II subunit alpha
VPWESFVNTQNQHLAVPEAIDLVSKLVCYDPQERVTALQALEHPYIRAICTNET